MSNERFAPLFNSPDKVFHRQVQEIDDLPFSVSIIEIDIIISKIEAPLDNLFIESELELPGLLFFLKQLDQYLTTLLPEEIFAFNCHLFFFWGIEYEISYFSFSQ